LNRFIIFIIFHLFLCKEVIMKKLLYTIGTMAVVLALSCGKEEEEAPPPDPMPLAVGNW